MKYSIKNKLIWITDPFDLQYLTGLKFSRATLVIHPDETFLFVDGKYREACKSLKKISVKEESAIKETIAHLTYDEVLFDGKKLSYDGYQTMLSYLPHKKVSSERVLDLCRMIKTDKEIVLMEKSADLNFQGYQHILSCLVEGVTEKGVAWEFEKFCREKGAEQMAFSPIISFGKHTSMPHYRAGNARLKKGDPVMIDIGVVVDGYASDFTRSHLFQGENLEYAAMHTLVLKAAERALSLCRPGKSLYEIDQEVRLFFKEWGVDTLFNHSLGHSLGLEVHEFPLISPKTDKALTLKENMVVTIEPGLYREGLFGVRHEDTIVITKEGYENFYESWHRPR